MLRRLSRGAKDAKDDDDNKSDTSRSTPPPRKDSLAKSLRRGSLPRKGSQSTNPQFAADDEKRSSMPRRKGSQATRNPSFVADASIASGSTHSSITRTLGTRVGRMFGRSTSSSRTSTQDAEKLSRVSRELTASKAASSSKSSKSSKVLESRVPSRAGTGEDVDLVQATRELKDQFRRTLEDAATADSKKASAPADKTLTKRSKAPRGKSPSARGLLARRGTKKKDASSSSKASSSSSSSSSKKNKKGSSKSAAKREAKERELKIKQRKAMPYPGVMDLSYLGPKETFIANLGRNPNNTDFGDGPRMVQSRA
jgi:hypothetical protein